MISPDKAFWGHGYEAGKKAELERITALLYKWGEEAGCFCCASDSAASEIIKLINGEEIEND